MHMIKKQHRMCGQVYKMVKNLIFQSMQGQSTNGISDTDKLYDLISHFLLKLHC